MPEPEFSEEMKQEESLKAYAEYRELEIVGNYCDAGKSGKNIKGRPAFRQMMTDIKSQKDDIAFVSRARRYVQLSPSRIRSSVLVCQTKSP